MIIPAATRLNEVSEYYFSRKLEQIRRMSEAGRDVINLGIGSPDLPPSDAAIEAAAQSLRSPKSHGYSSYRSTPELRQGMARWYERVYGVKADPEREVLPLLGSKEGLFYIAMAFLNPGDRALVPDPGYPAYSSVTRLAGGEPLRYDLREENGWAPDFDALSRMDLRKVKLMWVNYPHMPTGQAADERLFQRLVEFGSQNGILICHDNPYGLVLNDRPPLSLLRFDTEKSVSLELNSFSKSFNMAGWRVGMMLGNADVVDTVLKVKSNVDSGMFQAVQAGAIRALENSDEWHAKRNDIYRERREIVYRIFDRLKFAYSKNQTGLFVWAKAPASVSNVETCLDEILEKAAVFLTPGLVFGSNGERYARISLCASRERLQEALERLEAMK